MSTDILGRESFVSRTQGSLPEQTQTAVEKFGRIDSIPCHAYYTGISQYGRPTTSTSYQSMGFRVVTDRTTIPQNILDPSALEGGKRKNTVVEVEITDLAPFYKKPKKN